MRDLPISPPILRYDFSEILEPLAQVPLCYKTETDENHGNNREPDEETECPLDNNNHKKDAEYRCDCQKYG